MSNIRTLSKSFNGGELTPEFYGQLADPKFQTGLALARNFLIYPHGPAANRPGTTFVREVKDSTKKTRIIGYTYSTTQTFAIEMGEGYFRFHTQGATLLVSGAAAYNGATAYTPGQIVVDAGTNYYCIADTTGNAPPNVTYWYAMPASGIFEIPNSFVEADLFDIHFVQSQDIITFAHPNYPPQQLQRRGANYWTLVVETFTPTLTAPTNVAARATVVTGGSRSAYIYKATAVGETGLEESLGSLTLTGATVNISGVTAASPGVITTSSAHGLAIGDTIYITGIVGMTELNGYYRVNTIPLATTLTVQDPTGAALNTSTYTAYVSGGTLQIAAEVAINNLLTSGNYNTITYPAVSGATRYNIYKQSNGLFGFIGQTDQLTFKDENITADISKTPPIPSAPFTGAGNYPGAVSYYEQRKAYAGTTNKPQNFWMTQSGTENNLGYSIPSRDDDAISFRVAAREANTIRHIVPLNSLMLLTSSAEWRVTSVNSDALTPTSISIKPQSYVGASNVQPVLVNNNLLYAAARGGHIRELGYNWQQQSYASGDLSLRAPHLFDGLLTVDMAYSKAPQPVVWAPSSNGELVAITYVPEQSIGAWHHHDSFTKAAQSLFESCCVVAEGNEDVLYVIIQRVINGATVRLIERLHSRLFTDPADQYFVDCGVSYDNPITITGITSANPVIVTAPSHGLNNGDPIDITEVVGVATIAPGGVITSLINGKRFLVAASSTNTFKLTDESGVDIDGATWPVYLRGGVVRKAISTITSGLSHLEGETVSILANGAVSPPQVVTSGGLPASLEYPASRIHIGLPITSDVKTLPASFEIPGYGQGRQKNVNMVWVRVSESNSLFAGPSFTKLKEAKVRTNETYGIPPRLQSREISIAVTPQWQDSGSICIRQSDPLALTIVSMSLELAIGS